MKKKEDEKIIEYYTENELIDKRTVEIIKEELIELYEEETEAIKDQIIALCKKIKERSVEIVLPPIDMDYTSLL
ncbi:hypothetical protein [Leptobacterium sp. I13]|uniref:hypothetical protein n=1 Tax=Leptobacterium meishanense TaxID=3128904 RepID=UPI0030EDA4C8